MIKIVLLLTKKLSNNKVVCQPFIKKKNKNKNKNCKITKSKKTNILFSFNFNVFKKTLSEEAKDLTRLYDILKKKKKVQKTVKDQIKGITNEKFSK
jgi:hypothetical protein